METAPGVIGQGAPTLRAIVYARVSTDEQAASGLGVEAQLHACREWARREGRVVAGEFIDDGIGGATELHKRPALVELLNEIRAGDVVLVAKRDRIGRDLMIGAIIEAAVTRKGGRFVSAAGEGTEGDEPSNILMRRVVDSFAEYERLVIKVRTKAALAAKRRRGELISRMPYGCDLAPDGKTLVPNETEVAWIGLMLRWRSEGFDARRIASELNKAGAPPKRGTRWYHASVKSILERAGRQRRAEADRCEQTA